MSGKKSPSGPLFFGLFLASGFLAGFGILSLLRPGWAAASSALLSGDPLIPVVACALGFALCAFAAGWISGDYSWVDRLWSVLPVFFAWFYAWRGGFRLPVLAAAALITAWGLRLSWNFAKKGGYSGTEDYRWALLRARIGNPFLWQCFNLGFISLMQVGIFVLFTAPMAKLSQAEASASPFRAFAFVGALALMAAAIVLESVADAQQWSFQEAKRRAREGSEPPGKFKDDVARGFRASGLFSLSRHPNYLGELLVWAALYLASAGWTGRFIDWTLAGPVSLCALFSGSTVFTESISASKYPGYADYRRRVGAIIPWKKR